MSKRWAILLIVAVALAALALRALRPTNEPTYEGRKLSFWLEEEVSLNPSTGMDGRAARVDHALNAIGTNAVPWLLKWMNYEPDASRQWLARHLPKRITKTSLGRSAFGIRRDLLASRAKIHLGRLGPNVTIPLLPELTRMFEDTKRPATSYRAMYVLSGLGQAALPHMLRALANTNQPRRDALAVYIARTMAPQVGTNPCLPALLSATSDPDPDTRRAAIRMVTEIAPEALTIRMVTEIGPEALTNQSSPTAGQTQKPR